MIGLLMCTVQVSSQNSQEGTSTGPCHLRELDLCAASLLVFLQSPDGMATTEQEINRQCVHVREADQCFNSYTRRCMTPIQRQLVSLSTNGTVQVANEYCRRGSPLRLTYLKHSKCLNQVQRKEQKSCMRDLQAALELLSVSPTSSSSSSPSNSTLGPGRQLTLGCCAFKRFESCIGNHIEKRCGKEAIQFVQLTFRRLTSRLPETMCRSYRPDSSECRAILPKSGTIPKGAKSSSIISRLMTAYSGL